MSLPYTDACPPLIGSRGSMEELVAGLEEERRRGGIPQLECRAELAGSPVRPCTEAVIHTLPTGPDLEQMERGLKRSVRQHIAKGRRSGVTVRRAETLEELADTFYALHVRTRKRQGVPVQPRGYFVRLWQRILEPGLGFCLLAESGDRPIAGAVFLAWKNTAAVQVLCFRPPLSRPAAELRLLWEAICWSGANGYETLDFGRTDLRSLRLAPLQELLGSARGAARLLDARGGQRRRTGTLIAWRSASEPGDSTLAARRVSCDRRTALPIRRLRLETNLTGVVVEPGATYCDRPRSVCLCVPLAPPLGDLARQGLPQCLPLLNCI